MHGALVRDLLQARSLFCGEVRAREFDGTFDAMDESVGGGLAFGAVFGVDASLSETHRDAFERPLFAASIERDGHRDATAERGENERVGVCACAVAAETLRLVRDESVPVAVAHFVLQVGAGSDRDISHVEAAPEK